MAYLLDADVFIQASNLHYRFEFCPAFWDWIDQEHQAGRIFSVDRIRKEILDGEYGDLIKWVKARSAFFLETATDSTYRSLKKLARWAKEKYKPGGYAKFFESGDFILVGFAHANNHVVVSQERGSDGAQVKIPNACDAIGVRCIRTWELLKEL